jgi:hypothetical protein
MAFVNEALAFWRARAAPLGRLCEPETQLEPEPFRSDLLDLESPLQPGSAAKAAFSLERSCPMESMAPVLAIMEMAAGVVLKRRTARPRCGD